MNNVNKALIYSAAILGLTYGASEVKAQDIENYFKPKLTLKERDTKSPLFNFSKGNALFPYGNTQNYIGVELNGERQIAVDPPADGSFDGKILGAYNINGKLAKNSTIAIALGLEGSYRSVTKDGENSSLGNGTLNAGVKATFSKGKYYILLGGRFPLLQSKDTSSAVLREDASIFIGGKIGVVKLSLDGSFSDKGLTEVNGVLVANVDFLSFGAAVKRQVNGPHFEILGGVGANIFVTKNGNYRLNLNLNGGVGRDEFLQGRAVDHYTYLGTVSFEKAGAYEITLGVNGKSYILDMDRYNHGANKLGFNLGLKLLFPQTGKTTYKKHSDNLESILNGKSQKFTGPAPKKDVAYRQKLQMNGRTA